MVMLAVEGSGGSKLTYHVRKASVSVGASSSNDVVVRGLAMLWWGKDTFALPHFSGITPINILGAFILPHRYLFIMLSYNRSVLTRP